MIHEANLSSLCVITIESWLTFHIKAQRWRYQLKALIVLLLGALSAAQPKCEAHPLEGVHFITDFKRLIKVEEIFQPVQKTRDKY